MSIGCVWCGVAFSSEANVEMSVSVESTSVYTGLGVIVIVFTEGNSVVWELLYASS